MANPTSFIAAANFKETEMSSTLTLKDRPLSAHSQPIACRLRPREVIGRRGLVPFMAEVELENVSDFPMQIEYELTALQYFDLIVRDAATGAVMSQGHYADRFSPTAEAQYLRLAPGEKFTANVHFFATAPQALTVPGTYSVQAIYEYDGFRAESELIEVTV